MRLPSHPRFRFALLALTIAMVGAPGVGRADAHDDQKGNPEAGQQRAAAQARPDLELTGGDFASPDNRRVIKFTVKNVGTAPSSVTTMVRVVTSTPEPTPNFREIPLPPKTGVLKPGESGILQPGESANVIYSLAAECNGHVVQALVSDPLDLQPANNRVTDKLVCVAIPPSPWDDLVVGPAPRVGIPERMQPGQHDAPVIEANRIYTSYSGQYFTESEGCGYPDSSFRLSDTADFGYAGWLQRETYDSYLGIEFRDCAYVGVAWTYVDFPYELLELDDIPDKTITRAVLTFKEGRADWRDPDYPPGCITTLDFPGGYHRSGPPRKSFVVTEPVAEQVASSPAQRFGNSFRLMGAFGSVNDLEAYGSSSCMSGLDNFQLHVSYQVP